MKAEIDKMQKVWDRLRSEITQPVPLAKVNLDEIVSSVFALGPFYYYLINFSDMSITDVSSGFEKVHGIAPEQVKHINQVLSLIHRDDMEFLVKVEEKAHRYIYQKGIEKVTRYKASYNLRFKTADGTYRLFNHQSLILSVDEQNNIVRSINIHTDISHITNKNHYKWSAIGIAGEPSYLNMDASDNSEFDTMEKRFSKRELEVLRLIAKGCSTKEIAKKLYITADTVKAHRKHIMEKSGCINMAELSARSITEGWI